jgi:two-component system chemotaxis response regulator CheB
MSQKIRVLVADDSPFVCRLLTSYLHSAPDFEVVDAAFNGRLALEKVKALGPDALTLDLEMPEMDGLEALARIMRECPTPVVAVSGVSGRAATRTLQALDLGAVDFVLKYAPGANVRPAECAGHVQQLGSESLLPNLMEVKG